MPVSTGAAGAAELARSMALQLDGVDFAVAFTAMQFLVASALLVHGIPTSTFAERVDAARAILLSPGPAVPS